MLEGCFHHLDGGFLLADLSIHKGEIRRRLEVIRPANRAGGGHDTPATCEEGLGDAQADSAGRAGDDGDGLLGGIHRMSFWLNFCTSITLGNRSLYIVPIPQLSPPLPTAPILPH